MIAKYEKQAIKSAVWFGISIGVFVICVFLAMLIANMPVGLGIFLATGFAAACVAALVFYFRGCTYLGWAKGYTTATFLVLFLPPLLFIIPGTAMLIAVIELLILPTTVILLKDKSNPAKEAEEEKYQGARCVCCGIRISPVIKICPKCGWTQPAADIPAAA